MAPGLPLVGSGAALFASPYQWWAEQYQRLGPVFRLRIPIEGGTWIAVAGREANALLASEGQRLFSQAMTYPRAQEVLGTSLHPSITEGDLQIHLKRQIAPGFSRHAAVPHLPSMARFARDYVRGWLPDQRLNVVEETARLGLNCISIFATGEELGHDTDRFARYATVFTGVIAMSWPGALMKVPAVRDAREALDAMIEERLARHRASPPGPDRAPDYFDFLLRGTMPDGSPLPDRVRVVFGQIPFKNMGVYAGRVINHTLYQIVKRPEVLEAVLPEVDAVLGDGRDPSATDLARLETLRATIKETLRVLPIAVALQRVVCEPFDFAGYRFEVGDRCFFPISVPHFLPECFPDPARFDLGRFLPGRAEEVPSHAYKPFGMGHHACVATGLFEMITSLVLATIVHTWRLEARYELRTIVDALPGPWPFHEMRVVERRRPRAPARGSLPPPFAQQPDAAAALFDVVSRAELLRVEDGFVLFRQGDAADRVYLVQRGAVAVTRRGVGGEEREVATLGPGSVVGEIGILHGVPRTATVVARGATTLVAVSADAFREVIARTDATAEELAQLAARRHASSLLASVLESGAAPDLGSGEGLVSKAYAAGEVIALQGEEAHCFYVLASGEVEVVHETAGGTEVALATLRAPDCFGEIGLLDRRPRTATVRAGAAGARVLALDRDAFERVLGGADARADLASLAAERLAAQLARSVAG